MVLHQYTVAGMPGLLFRFSHELQARHRTGQRDDVVVNGNSDLRSILGRKVAFFEIPFDDALDGRVGCILRSAIGSWEFDTVVASRIEPFPNRVRIPFFRVIEADLGLLGSLRTI